MPAKPPNEMVVTEEDVPDGTVIWRYFKFERFVDILKTHSFWFSRPFRFENDGWDGFYPPSYVRQTRPLANDEGIRFEEFDGDFQRRRLRGRYANFVNCWHMSDHESDAMWKLYTLAKTGIAIQSTVGDAKEGLWPVYSGRVIYYDPSQVVRFPTSFVPDDILFKRCAFASEKEYRLWFRDYELFQRIEAGGEFREEGLSCGRPQPITEMQRLIKKIVVAPGASDEFIEQVRAACAEVGKTWLWKLIERSYSDRMWDSFTR